MTLAYLPPLLDYSATSHSNVRPTVPFGLPNSTPERTPSRRPRGTVLRAFAWDVVLYDLLELRPGFLPQW